MRITGGLARGIVLDVPQKSEVRPATDFVRERILGRLATTIQGSYVLDCCAGTGAYGLEALSRGAKHVCFLEKNPQIAAVLQNNCKNVCKSLQSDVDSVVKIFLSDVFFFDFSGLEFPINYIFFDPPYSFWEENRAGIRNFLEKLAHVFPESRMVIEYPSHFVWTEQMPWQPIYPQNNRKKKYAPQVNLFQPRSLSSFSRSLL